MPVKILSRTVGQALALPLGAVAAVTGRKPLHPVGVVLSARLERDERVPRWGVPWLDGSGTDAVVVRLSRAVGLPMSLPDILGMALRFEDASGVLHDLLLATTGEAPGARHILQPRINPATAVYSSLFPYRTPRGPIVLAALPTDERNLTCDPAALAKAVTAEPLVFRLAAASLTGEWEPFGTLEITGMSGADLDPPVDFDPVLYPLPGLVQASPFSVLREPAYRLARVSRLRRGGQAGAAIPDLHSA
jgi:hypothetical protein